MYFRIAARGPVTHARAPSLERLLARADAPVSVTDWRADAYRILVPGALDIPAVATAALTGCASRACGAWVAMATPVHLVAGMRSVCMAADGILPLECAEADALAADFNRVFGGDGLRLCRGSGDLLLCLFDAPLDIATTAPEDVVGRDVWNYLPRGADSARVRRLMSEVEMWLFEHALNEHRRARAAPVISGLWLWGGGPADAPLPVVTGWTAGSDPLFGAFARQPRYPGAASSGVVVIADWPGTAAFGDAEMHFVAPALAELESGHLHRIECSAGDRSFGVSRRGLNRFWRKQRPWWEAFGAAAGAGRDD